MHAHVHCRTCLRHTCTVAHMMQCYCRNKVIFLFCLCWVLLSVILLYSSSSWRKRMLYLCTPGICKTTETSSIRHLFGLGGWVGGSPPILSLFGFSEMSDNCRPPLKNNFFLSKYSSTPITMLVYLQILQIYQHCDWCAGIFWKNEYPVRNLKGEVRTINDRNICERRSCMKNNGKSPTFKFVSGEERRPSEVQQVSRNWRLPGATHSSADLTWIRKWLKIQAPELSELESVGLELGSCCSDFDKLVSDEICRTRKRQFEIPFHL